MYTFAQLLLRNIGLALIFIISISAVSIIMLSSLLESKTDQHAQMITAFTQQFEFTNNEQQAAQNLSTQLTKISNYNSLIISNLAGDKLSDFSNNNTGFMIPFVAPKIKQITLSPLPITLHYQLNFQSESTLVLVFIIIATTLSLVLVVFAVAMSTKRHKVMFDIISQQIKSDFALINNNSVDDVKNIDSDSKMLEIPELKQGIADIKSLMAQQLESVSHLEQAAYVDHLTKLDNRSRFVQFYENQIRQDSPVKFGVLSITRCSELQTINQIHGYKEGDSYIAQVANLLKRALSPYPDGKLFRLNSSDFACILPNIKLKEAESFTTELTALFNAYQLSSELESVAYTGLVSFDKSKPLGELLALVDTSVSIAQTQAPNSWYSQTDTDLLQKNSVNYGNQNWRQEIDSVIENRRITLLVQPIQPSGRNSRVYGEILARFLNSNDDMLPTSSFLAMAEKLDKMTAIDKLIIETTINEINQKNMYEHSFGINLSARSICDEHFIVWLERRLLRESKVARQLVFEITEYGLQQNIKTSKRLIDMLHRVGAKVTVERFGVGLTSFKFFRDLTPDYIKMDSSYTRDIDDDKNNQYFLRLMVDLAHRLSINVLAESVESQEEKHTLEKLLIDGCQGFYIGKPKPL